MYYRLIFQALTLVVGLISISSAYENSETNDSGTRVISAKFYRSNTFEFAKPKDSAFTFQDGLEIVKDRVTISDEQAAKIRILNEEFAKLKRSTSPKVERSSDEIRDSEISKSRGIMFTSFRFHFSS